MLNSETMGWLIFIQLLLFLGPGALAYAVYLLIERHNHRHPARRARAERQIWREDGDASDKERAA